VNRELISAVRRFADSTSDRIGAMASTRQELATISAVTPGGAKDGNALVELQWRGDVYIAAGYAAAYTPVVGHRVVCDYIDNQLIVAYRVIGMP
jgi:hypothetical protein